MHDGLRREYLVHVPKGYDRRKPARVQLCVTEDGGHSRPGGQKPRGDGTPSNAISATDVMWELFWATR